MTHIYQKGKTYDELNVGDSASFSKTISETDVYLYAGISGDFNPMHVNEEYAKKTPFGARIAHGPLTTGMVAPVLGMQLPGLGTVAIDSQARFKRPVYFGDTITCTLTLKEKKKRRKTVVFDVKVTNQNGKVVATGSVEVLPPAADQP